MDTQIPDLAFIATTLTIGCILAIYSWQRSKIIAIVILSWAILSLFTAQIPFFQNSDSWTDRDAIGYYAFNAMFLIPVIVLLVLAWRSTTFKSFMSETPTWVLTATQLYRLSGSSLIFLYLQGVIPVEIGLPNGIMDILIGLTALPLAWVLYRGYVWGRNTAIIWNVIGLLDFIIAATVISLSFEGLITVSPVPVRMGLYPLSLITIYQVAIAAFIHIYLLQRLLRQDTVKQ